MDDRSVADQRSASLSRCVTPARVVEPRSLDARKAFVLLSVAIAILSFRGNSVAAAQSALPNDAAQLYNLFLDRWITERYQHPEKLNIGRQADTLPGLSIDTVAKCAQGFGDYEKTFSEDLSFAATPLAQRPGVHLVDAKEWRTPPKQKNPDGRWPESGYFTAMKEGLLTFSNIAFNAKRDEAVMHYQFYCGLLCGWGEFLKFKRAEGSWRIEEGTCGKFVN